MMLAGAGFDFAAAGVQHVLCVLRRQATQFIGIIRNTPNHMCEFVKEGGDPRGQGIAVEGTHAQCMAPNNTRETAGGITRQNISSLLEKGAIGVQQYGSVGSGILLNGGGIGMLEEGFSMGGLEDDNVLGAITKNEIEGFEGGSDVGICFAEPGAAGIFSAENSDDVLAGLRDGGTARTESLKPRTDRILRDKPKGSGDSAGPAFGVGG